MDRRGRRERGEREGRERGEIERRERGERGEREERLRDFTLWNSYQQDFKERERERVEHSTDSFCSLTAKEELAL